MSNTTVQSDGWSELAHLSANERYLLLASDRRRVLLDALKETTVPTALSSLATEVAAREEGVDAGDDEAVERVAVTLHHNHLPRMEDADLLRYDATTNCVVAENVSPE
ncbi:DUF7344 domain-containing protein [Haloarcula nitratireducens]|uniref:DUF7344 domain-containing protein n=1 Tax=Haloarcula nitratireducens TaxID=2487749 RepID=A0AAW4PAV0_9EURY|nr:hypothetical protein [Halomicroarcula nitratireducens]MBX0294605.1 hypothetical protein [Halomicroarcula nitratireducens]